MNGAAISPNAIVVIFGFVYIGTTTIFGLVFTSQNRKIEKVEKESVGRGYCHKAQDVIATKIDGSEKAIKAELNGVKTTLCAKIDGIKRVS